MQIDLLHIASDCRPGQLIGRNAVVFDVLRASSTITTALANGCREVIPVATVEEARTIAVNKQVILGGERGALKIEDFDCGNSPLEYSRKVIQGKTLVLTTTNGTKAIHNAAGGGAENIIIGCLLNARAAAQYSLTLNRDITLLCAGTVGKSSLEDTLAAGLTIYEIIGSPVNFNRADSRITLTDPAVAAYHLAKAYINNPLKALYDSLHGQKLLQMGLEKDLAWCANTNIFNLVPVYRHNAVQLV